MQASEGDIFTVPLKNKGLVMFGYVFNIIYISDIFFCTFATHISPIIMYTIYVPA